MARIQLLLVAVVVILLACLPLVIEKDSTLNLLVLILLFIIMASSWNILGGFTGQTSLGHAAFFGLGSLATRLLWIQGFPLLPSLLAGGGLAVVFALVIGIPAFKLKGVYFAIGTLALGQILFVTVGNLFPTISALPVEALRTYQLAPRYYLFLVLTILTVGFAYLLANSRVGLGMMAVREDEDAAEALGVNARRHKLLALVFSAFLAGMAGSAFAYYHVSYYYQFPFAPIWSFDTLTMVYIGGQGTIIGPIVGAIFFVLLREFLVLNVGEYHLIVFGVLFILVVLFLPGGFVEAWEKIRNLLVRRRSKRDRNASTTA
ncbi:MAG: branched-chain amino acid ABC transporter permease [Anaerolineales bacterium]|nr:MAG: branched-chain amino acid ABC transporter permease [Anaerolineales bacterium]